MSKHGRRMPRIKDNCNRKWQRRKLTTAEKIAQTFPPPSNARFELFLRSGCKLLIDLDQEFFDPDRAFLQARGWLPLGINATTGLEGWGKRIGGRAVTVDQPEALRIEDAASKPEAPLQ